MQYLILTCFPSFSEITSKIAGDSSKPYSVWIEHLNKESIKSDLLFNCALTYTYSPSSPFSTEVRWSLRAIGNLSIMFHLVTFMIFYDDTETAAWDKKMRLRLRLCAYDQPQVSYNVVIGPSLLDFNLAGSTLHILTKPWTLDWLRFPIPALTPPDPRGVHRLHADRVVLLAHGGAASRIRFFAQSIISTVGALVVIAV